MLKIKSSLLTSTEGEIVVIQGKTFCTEEAAGVWQEMTTAERAQYQGMTDLQIIESIYTTHFSYLKAGT